MSGDIYRKSCYSCKYANRKRVGDFSLGDYWGVEKLHLPLNTFNGCSLLVVNSDKATKFLSKIETMNIKETRVDEAISQNEQLKHPSRLPDSRKERIKEFELLTGTQIERVYLSKYRKRYLKGLVKSLIPYKLKVIIRGGGKQ